MSSKVYYRVTVVESGVNMEVVNIADLDTSVKHYDVVESSNYTKILDMYESVAMSNPDYVQYIMDFIRNNSYSMIQDYTDFIRELKAKGVRTVPSLEEYIATYDTLRTESLGFFSRDLIDEFDYIKQVVTGTNNIAALIKTAAYNETGIPLDQETANRLFGLLQSSAQLVSVYVDRITDIINPLDNDLLTMSLSQQIVPYRNAVFVSLNDTQLATQEVVANFLRYGPVIPEAEHTSVTTIPFPSVTIVTDAVNINSDGEIVVVDDPDLGSWVPDPLDITPANMTNGITVSPNPTSYLNGGVAVYGNP